MPLRRRLLHGTAGGVAKYLRAPLHWLARRRPLPVHGEAACADAVLHFHGIPIEDQLDPLRRGERSGHGPAQWPKY